MNQVKNPADATRGDHLPPILVISAENSAYLLWQCLAMYASAARKSDMEVAIVVHGSEPLLKGYRVLQELGVHVKSARNYRNDGRFEYPPRNAPGTLLAAADWERDVILCDPDLLVRTRLRANDFSGGLLSWDAVAYMQLDGASERVLRDVALARKVDLACIARMLPGGGVPHRISLAIAREFALRWLECTDLVLIASLFRQGSAWWTASMWGFVVAAAEMRIAVETTDLCDSSWQVGATQLSALRRPLLHYTYGDATFDKRNFADAASAAWVWRRSNSDSTVASWLIRELNQSAEWYRAAGVDVEAVGLYEPSS